jgi:hypothetical protein
MKRLAFILTLAALLFGALFTTIPVAVVKAVSCDVGHIWLFNGSNGTGEYRDFCADDYPLAGTGGSFDGLSFNSRCPVGGCNSMDNHVSSYQWENTVPVYYKFRLFKGYYFAGSYITIQKLSGQTQPINLSSTWTNTASSFLSCGTGCADDPP